MNVSELHALCGKHHSDKNYQHRDKSWAEIDAMAQTSFNRLSADQRQRVWKVCNKYGLEDKNLIARFRFMAQTNLFFLCKLLEKYKDVSDREYTWTDGTVHNTHEEICNAFFVRKDPTVPDFEDFAINYAGNKQRLLLVPRGGFKSSIDMADCVQWIICWPEVTILVLTGVLDLAKDFVGEIKGHFTLIDGASDTLGLFTPKKMLKARENKDGSPLWLQVLFPEHCIPQEEGKGYEFQTPACPLPDKECTVFAGSIEQSMVGWHVGVMKLDDVVTNENSQTIDRLKNVNKQVSINQAMLHPYGFYDKIGTWYDAEDTYGQDIKNAKVFEDSGELFPMSIYLRPAWWPNEAAVKAGKIPEEMTEQDYELWFNEGPHSLTYEFLKFKQKTDPYFAIKYLNDPTQMHVIKFPRELLLRHTINANLLPDTGMIVTTVDTAYSTKSWADFTVIITALIYGGRFYVIDMKRGRYNEYELPAMIAATALQWKPKRICIEETGAIKYIARECYREMDKLKIRVPIELVPLGKGDKKVNSKQKKAGPLLRYIGDDRFKFLNSCPGLEELYTELEKFGTAAVTHDDIVDALAILVNQFATYADMEGQQTVASTGFVTDKDSAKQYEYLMGQKAPHNKQGSYDIAAKQFSWMQQEFPEATPQDIAKSVVADQKETYFDPMADLWG